jgi:NAD(P)-dependent dehydrogenase (short-subunit alcohol dehydrogenase family)/rhamnose utilization protein RhaD (predicted bifunctional aldolase and dehydrogenase)
MKPEISELLSISDFYGTDKKFVIAGCGNASFKDKETIWIKTSGTPLKGITEEGLVTLNREKMAVVSTRTYSDDASRREEEFSEEIFNSILDPGKGKRVPVEASIHNLISYRFVVHLHPSIINGLLCSRNARNLAQQIFGDKALFVPYTDPGYNLFIRLESELIKYREKFGSDPEVVLLENNGSVVSGDTTEEVRARYEEIIRKIEEVIDPVIDCARLPYNPELNKVLPAIRMLLSADKPKIIRYRHNSLIAAYYKSQQEFQKISHPLTPHIIPYCRHRYIYAEQSQTPERILESLRSQFERFSKEYNFSPRIIIIKDMGLFAAGDTVSEAETVLDAFEDLIRVCHYASKTGGTKLLTPEQVLFIDHAEAGRSGSATEESVSNRSPFTNKIVIVTGGAQGIGAGIAQSLYEQRANVVIADINAGSGEKFAASLNKPGAGNRVIFTETDVSDPGSVSNMISECVREFGGLDIMISNAGVLKAGGLEEIDADIFSKTTAINYNGYFLCVKYASEVMKIQNNEKPEYFTDIIQINSKSGLRGSNRNFSYAGAKFGGIGLTQSFALELAPNKIKVNSVCPGNFYDGPLWSDPQNGLFIQYLKAGKVPGARTVDDVRKFYEEQVPMKRGCRLEDLMKAIIYIVEQEYETGQAIPVTGGQVMLG